MKRTVSPPLPEERWYSVAELAVQFNRTPAWVRHLIKAYNLPRRVVRQGEHPRRILEVSYTTVQRLRRITRR